MKTHGFNTYVVLGIVAACALGSCGLKKEKITPSAPVKVTVQPIAARSVTGSRSYSGTVESGDGSELSFSVPGTVKHIYVSAGQKVGKGQLLAELDDESLVNTANMAQTTLDEARDAYARLQKLHDADALPDIKWVEVQSKLKQAENAYAVARRAVSDARIYAPSAGTVAEKLIDVGQTVVPALPAIRLVTLGDVKVTIPVPENEIASIPANATADIMVEALGGMHLEGKMAEKGVVANPLTRAYDVRFRVPNHEGKLLPGMICTVILNAADTTGTAPAIVLPVQSVLLSADNRNFVWLVKNGKASRRFVTQGGMTADGIVITDGVAPGDSVIVQGIQKVSEGTDVQASI